MIFKIKIEETLARTISVWADSEEEAIDKAVDLYNNCEIILDSDDYKGVTFTKEK